MKKIVFILLPVFLLIFIMFNYKYVFYNYYNFLWNASYDVSDFWWALKNHNKALEYKETAKILHNLWNDFFKLWEKQSHKKQKLDLWTTSEWLYINSLDLENDEETQFNLDYVREKIKELQESEQNKEEEEEKEEENKEEESLEDNNQEQNKEDNSSEEKQDSDSSTEEQTDSEWWEKEEDNILKQERAEQYKLGWDKELWNISEDEKKFLDNYLKFLEWQEKQNQQFFNKSSEENTSNIDSFYNIFWNWIQFDNFNNEEEKDW